MSERHGQEPAGLRSRRLRRLHLLIAAVIAGGVGCLLAGALQISMMPFPAWWRLILVALMAAFADLAVLHLRFGRQTYTFTWAEASIILGLALVPYPWLTLVAPTAIGAAHLLARRAPIKVAFNAASLAVGATLARLTCVAQLGTWTVVDVTAARTWLALASATTVYFVWNALTVATVIAWSQGLRVGEVLRRGIVLNVSIAAGNAVVAILLLTTNWQRSTVILVPSCVLLLWLTYRGYLRAMDERDVWQQLDGTVKETSRLDEREVARAAARRAVQLFKAQSAEIVLIGTGGEPDYVLTHVVDGTWSEPAAPSPDGPGRVDAPLAGIRGPVGTLRLGLEGHANMSKREQQVLATFVHGLGTSLQNARLYGEMRRQAQSSAHAAAHDALTGLANRTLLHQRAEAAIAEADRDGSTVGLLLLDLDHFKQINDTLGHSAGDELLRTVAARLSASLRGTDLVARLGGDEFAVLLSGLPDAGAADRVARDLIEVLARPVDHDSLRLVVEGSIGVACYPGDASALEDLLRLADVAMYQAKQSRGSFAHYRQDRDDSNLSRLLLVAEVRNALAADEFVLHFQPQVDLATARVVGVEVLTRWQHPTRGLLPPSEFISVTEHSGLVREFTLHVLETAVRTAADWYAEGVGVPIAVNLSVRNLLDRQLPGDVAAILARHGLPPERLVLEITETMMMGELDVVEDVLARLRHLGAQLSVDDFGTGYSSLAFLQRVAVNELKVDRSFVAGMLASDSDTAIVRATVELAHGLGLRVVAEGVETADHTRVLNRLGCDVAQGWHFGRPVDGPATLALLRGQAELLARIPASRLPDSLAGLPVGH